jgi:hypothetical protein
MFAARFRAPGHPLPTFSNPADLQQSLPTVGNPASPSPARLPPARIYLGARWDVKLVLNGRIADPWPEFDASWPFRPARNRAFWTYYVHKASSVQTLTHPGPPRGRRPPRPSPRSPTSPTLPEVADPPRHVADPFRGRASGPRAMLNSCYEIALHPSVAQATPITPSWPFRPARNRVFFSWRKWTY